MIMLRLKFFFVFLLLSFGLHTISAQEATVEETTDKGSIMFITNTSVMKVFGGFPLSSGFYVLNFDGDKSYLLSLNGTGLYGFSDSFFAGLQFGISRNWADEFNETTILGGPVARYYFPVNNSRIFLGAQLGLGYTKINFESFPGDAEDSNNILTYGLSAGYAHPLTQSVDVEAGLNYDFFSMDDEATGVGDLGVLGVRLGIAIRF